MDKLSLLFVFIGGGMGSLLRFFIDFFIVKKINFPLATFVSNVLACLILGLFLGYIAKKSLHPQLIALIAIGFCGGFSTFSTFAKENVELLQSGHMLTFVLNVSISIIAGMSLFALGYMATSN